MRKLEPGTNVRIEHNAKIIELMDKDNPFWYYVEYPDGTREAVSLARIHTVVDHTRAVMDDDCSIQVFSPRLSAEGALDLLLWLETHRHEFEAVVTPPEEMPEDSHEYLQDLNGHNQEVLRERVEEASQISDAQIEYEAEMARERAADG